MDTKVKSGEEVIKEFFDNVGDVEGVDEVLFGRIYALYKNGDLSEASMNAALQQFQHEALIGGPNED